jgi:DNA-binding transcriptional regulator YdaS (Cro superfamily)
MDLREHLKSLTRAEREAIATKSGTSLGHLVNVSYGYKPCSPELASGVERATRGAVTRQELRPDDWRDIWPELAPKKRRTTTPAGI